jgi:hypothetical protein
MAYNDTETEHVEIPATDARQGRWGQHALWMLVAIALFGTWLARSGDFSAINHKAESNMQSSATPTPLVQPKQTANDVRPTDRR